MSDDVARLAKFLGMMGSDHDGEILNAARMAEKLRKSLNKSWSALLTGASDSKSNSSDFLARMKAEMQVFNLQQRVAQLEKELATKSAGGYGAGAKASAKASSTKSGPRKHSGKGPSPMLAEAIKLARRADGVTREELKSVSNKQQPWTEMLKNAERFGYTFSTEREWRFGRYRTTYYLTPV
jgi:hypothetical protein